MLTKETLQTAIESVETVQADYISKMGPTEKGRFARCILELKDAMMVLTEKK